MINTPSDDKSVFQPCMLKTPNDGKVSFRHVSSIRSMTGKVSFSTVCSILCPLALYAPYAPFQYHSARNQTTALTWQSRIVQNGFFFYQPWLSKCMGVLPCIARWYICWYYIVFILTIPFLSKNFMTFIWILTFFRCIFFFKVIIVHQQATKCAWPQTK